MTIDGVLAEFESTLGEFVSVEVQLAVTAAIVIAALAVGGYIVPRTVDWLRRLTATWSHKRFGDSAAAVIERVDSKIPLSFILTLLVRAIQLGVLFIALFSLLVVWGLLGPAWWLIGLGEVTLPALSRLVGTAVVLVVAILVNDVIGDVVHEFSEDKGQVSAHQEQILTRVLQVALIIVALTAILSIWRVDLGGLLVGAGFLGIVFGLAARQTLGSLLAGFVLMFSRPFEIGDWISTKDTEGIVTKITIMNTHVRNFDGEHVVIPNDNIANQAITNRSRDGKLRIHVEVGIDYDDDPERAKEIAREAVEASKFVDNNPNPQVFPVGFGDSAVTLDIRFWISPPTPQRRWRATGEVVENVKEQFATESISIPFPQRTVGNREPGSADSIDRTDPAEESDSNSR